MVVTGLAGNVGKAVAGGLADAYTVIGLDIKTADGVEIVETDLTSEDAIRAALEEIGRRHGRRIASVVHLAAYFDFTGEEHPLYEKLNVEGTRKLLAALKGFEVEQIVYASTMLVHAPVEPGERIDESTPLAPAWVYPRSKADAEAVVREMHGNTPLVILRLAGLYSETAVVPTLANQIARIYERDLKSYLYAGDTEAGQSAIHTEDMVALFRAAIDRRAELPPETIVLAGEDEAMSYDDLQTTIGRLVHGEDEWRTLTLPSPIAKAGAWIEQAAEPIVPDALDRGEKPFIRPFMVDMASDHYALDISRAGDLLGWRPQHRLRDTLPAIVANLRADPAAWYERNGQTPPVWLESADEKVPDPEALRIAHEARYREAHFANIWAPYLNLLLGAWLVTSPAILATPEPLFAWSDVISGLLVGALALASMSPRLYLARWATAAVGFWVLMAPLVFWTTSAAAYLNATIVGALIIGFALAVRPAPGPSPVAAETGPEIPPGWDFTPSGWVQRIPIIALAVIGLLISRTLVAYQLGHTDSVFDPFFAGDPTDPRNGTEEIVTSEVSEAWPIPDAGLGVVVYMLEILIGLIGSRARWRTMPWVVVAFGILIVPLGVVSIAFIIIQPIVLGTWCTLCLIAAAAMLAQIPYSVDELVATGQFLARRARAGRPVLLVFFTGDTDDGPDRADNDDTLDRPPAELARAMVVGGVTVPWTLGICLALGVSLMLTRLTVGADGAAANADHLIGALVVTVTVIALAEVTRAVRFLNIVLGLALVAAPFVYGADTLAAGYTIAAGLAIAVFSIPRGPIRNCYGSWDRLIV